MAANPQKPGSAGRPLSPHLTVYHWAPTMAASITNRATGVALSVGVLALAWWLVSISNGPEGYQSFYNVATTPLGLLVLFGFTWSLAFHFLAGLRHLAWDMGYGFAKATANKTAIIAYALSLLIALGIFVFVWTGHAGYLQ
jgi:succinate dehydrogenase / fumarate reductase cytochrome b subunit